MSRAITSCSGPSGFKWQHLPSAWNRDARSPLHPCSQRLSTCHADPQALLPSTCVFPLLAARRLFLTMPELPKGTRSGPWKRWTYRMFTQAWSNLLEVNLHKSKAGSCLRWQKDKGRKVTASSTGTGTSCGSRLNPCRLGRGRERLPPARERLRPSRPPDWALWPPRKGVSSQLNSCFQPYSGEMPLLTLSGLRGERLCRLQVITTAWKKTGKGRTEPRVPSLPSTWLVETSPGVSLE